MRQIEGIEAYRCEALLPKMPARMRDPTGQRVEASREAYCRVGEDRALQVLRSA